MHAAREGGIEILRQIGCQDHHPVVLLHLLQQIRDLDVRVAIVRILDLRALAEQRVGLVEQQDRAGALRRAEDAFEILFGLADVLGDDRRKVDAVQLEPDVVGDHRSRHRLARTRGAGEEDHQAGAAARALDQSPAAVHALAVPDRRRDVVQVLQGIRGQHEVAPVCGRTIRVARRASPSFERTLASRSSAAFRSTPLPARHATDCTMASMREVDSMNPSASRSTHGASTRSPECTSAFFQCAARSVALGMSIATRACGISASASAIGASGAATRRIGIASRAHSRAHARRIRHVFVGKCIDEDRPAREPRGEPHALGKRTVARERGRGNAHERPSARRASRSACMRTSDAWSPVSTIT